MAAPNEGLLILSRADVARLMDYAGYVDAVEAAFRAAMDGSAVAPPAAAIHLPDGSFHAKGAALLGGAGVVAIKLNGNFPGQSRQPVHAGLAAAPVQSLILVLMNAYCIADAIIHG